MDGRGCRGGKGVQGCRGWRGGLKMLVKKYIYIFKKNWETLQNSSVPLNLSSQLKISGHCDTGLCCIKLSKIVQLNAWIFYSKLENEEH